MIALCTLLVPGRYSEVLSSNPRWCGPLFALDDHIGTHWYVGVSIWIGCWLFYHFQHWSVKRYPVIPWVVWSCLGDFLLDDIWLHLRWCPILSKFWSYNLLTDQGWWFQQSWNSSLIWVCFVGFIVKHKVSLVHFLFRFINGLPSGFLWGNPCCYVDQ